MRSSFVTKHNVKVITEVPEVDLALITYALDFYINSFLNVHIVLNSGDVIFRDVAQALSGTTLIWKYKLRRVSLFRKNTDQFVTVRKNKIYMQWTGNVTHSGLFHGLHHILHRKYVKKGMDLTHKDALWWTLASKFQKELEEEIKFQYGLLLMDKEVG